MALKTIDITISEENRDKGKSFRITEMPALQLDDWSMRALFMLARAGASIPEEMLSGGAASLATMQGLGLQAILFIPYEQAKPLLAELLACVRIKEPAIVRDLSPNDIEEASTLRLLRGEALKLHIGFFPDGARLSSTSGAQTSSSSNTPTSAAPSAPSSHPGKHR